jgi:hypothetical protein
VHHRKTVGILQEESANKSANEQARNKQNYQYLLAFTGDLARLPLFGVG